MLTDPSTSGRKYHKLVNYTTFICNESLCVVWADWGYKCIPIRAHAMVTMHRMPCGQAMKYNQRNLGFVIYLLIGLSEYVIIICSVASNLLWLVIWASAVKFTLYLLAQAHSGWCSISLVQSVLCVDSYYISYVVMSRHKVVLTWHKPGLYRCF